MREKFGEYAERMRGLAGVVDSRVRTDSIRALFSRSLRVVIAIHGLATTAQQNVRRARKQARQGWPARLT
jgi:hypothetical protein